MVAVDRLYSLSIMAPRWQVSALRLTSLFLCLAIASSHKEKDKSGVTALAARHLRASSSSRDSRLGKDSICCPPFRSAVGGPNPPRLRGCGRGCSEVSCAESEGRRGRGVGVFGTDHVFPIVSNLRGGQEALPPLRSLPPDTPSTVDVTVDLTVDTGSLTTK